jgi:hypothetical protein
MHAKVNFKKSVALVFTILIPSNIKTKNNKTVSSRYDTAANVPPSGVTSQYQSY